MNKKQIAIALGIMCLILTMTIVVQIRTINNSNQVVSSTFTSNELKDQVLKWKERYDETYEQLQTAERKLEEIRKMASENTEGSAEKEEELKKNNILLGLTDVSGEGVIVTIKDNSSVTSDTIGIFDDVSQYLVHNGDLLGVVSELKNAGAEAISINDQRIVSTTSITCEGNVININGEKISSPFVIKAIGNSLYMYSALTRIGGTVENYNLSGIPTTVKISNDITIKKYTGVLSSKYIREAE
ncbi:MAG: DUF881 domain-containing protein [Clostridia bacterium]